jgi:uncharacterized protein (DUF305 family)
MRTRQVVAAVATALALAACSIEINTGDDTGSDTGRTGGETAAGHNDADVSFATEMIPHHAQALAMVAMTRGRDLGPDFEALTEEMADTQRAEIDRMAGWLRKWGEDVPDDWGMGGGPGGMMDRDEMRDLMGPRAGPTWRDRATDRFEDMWLRMMIRHHEGAIEISAVERSAGEYQPAVALADQIIDAQSAEIETMQDMLR